MIDIYLFEIRCAEAIGDYRLADALCSRLAKIASTNHKEVQKKIVKKFNVAAGVKDISFSNIQQKFIVSAESSLSNNIKRDIQNTASPFPVSFRYSQNFQNIDELMAKPSLNVDRHVEDDMKNEIPGDEFIDMFDIDREPNYSEMKLTEENPPDDLSEGPTGMDQFLLDHARRDIEKRLGF